MKILIVIGSLRAASFSRMLAQSAQSLGPDGMSFESTDGRDLPLYDQDLDGEEKPESVAKLAAQITAADGLLFITPEFNYGIPGTLKNLIDWASRPAFRSPLKDKPAMIVAHSVSPTGGARAHVQLSSVLSGTLTPLHNAPSFAIPTIHEKFDENGTLSDEQTERRLGRALEQLSKWITA